ncbi:MAG: SUMF1/EgtB/PvdO family nonheme iron enzyme [Planctomycetaceae bacterium]|nr:SUMF1/EgtB/PvdO family nonheme iron enzyme [Planctomycetaceae bacterium]
MATLQELRAAGDWKGALRGSLGEPALRNAGAVDRIRRHLTGRRCLLLDAAAHAHKNGGLASLWKSLQNYPATGPLAQQLGHTGGNYEARRNLIRVLADPDADREQVKLAITQVVEVTAKSWNHVSHLAVSQLLQERLPSGPAAATGRPHEPSFLQLLPDDGLRSLFRELAATHSWLHPGLLLAGETLAAIYGDPRTPEATVHTWVLFAFEHVEKPQGIVARLRMERLGGGCGVLLPDAWSAAYLQMDEKFSSGLQHAWYAVQRSLPTPCECDWRWSLDMVYATKDLPGAPVTVPLCGRSAEVAFAGAMLAVDRRNPARPIAGDPLDPHVAVTAQFRFPATESLVLAPVDSVDIKSLPGKLMRRRIHAIVVANDQDAAGLPPTEEQLRFEPATTLRDAHRLLTRWPRITRAVKQSLHAAATRLRHKLCGVEVPDWRESGRRYVPSPLGEVLPQLRRETIAPGDPPLPRKLSAREQRAFACGRWSSPTTGHAAGRRSGRKAQRIRLFADSGLGKSIQLLICEQKIAGSRDDLIPVRLGKTDRDSLNLSAINWTDESEKVLRNVLEKCVLAHIPEDDRGIAEEWFREHVRRGQVVFLLDALDQARGALEGLGAFLNSALTQACPVVLAGRKESRSGKAAAFEGLSDDAWTTLKVLPFGRPEQERFLGSRLAPQLIPEEDEPQSWKDNYADELRKHGWKDLLGIPLLLGFLRDIAMSGQLAAGRLANRYDVYRAAVRQLISKGLSTVHESPELLRRQVERLLPQIAFEAVRRHDFSGVVQGDAFNAVLHEIANIYEQLIQVDLVTKHGVLDDFGPDGLEFRHRSFLEYFAGCRLVELFQNDSTRSEALRVLRDVHAVLDKHGEIRRDHDFLNSDGETIRHLPREWEWTLRFALCHAQGKDRDALAWQLIRLGNPWVVYKGIERDQLPLDRNIEQVCRWLVHRDWGTRDFLAAWPDKSQPPPAAAWVARCGPDAESVLTDLLLDRSTRDGAYLPPLRELLEATIAGAAAEPAWQTVATACQTALATYAGESRQLPLPALQRLLQRERFVPIPAGEFDPRPYHNSDALTEAGVTGPVPIPAGLLMADFPVTNAELESWCPTQRRWRGKYSHTEDQPAVYVSWFMGAEFCRWLGSQGEGAFGLPTEWEWEYACRAGSTTEFWWGEEMRVDLCWYGDTSGDSGTRSRQGTLAAEAAAGLAHPWGLHDVHGNVSEWCASPWDRSDSAVLGRRVVRGGSWAATLSSFVLRSASASTPSSRSGRIGVRLVWRCGVRPSESS